MIAPLAKLIDWSFIQVISLPWEIQIRSKKRRSKEQTNEPSSDLEEALKFVKGPQFLPVESQPASIAFLPEESGLHFRFPTPSLGGYAENNMVFGRLYRCGENWRERPVILLLHGAFGGGYKSLFPSIAGRCNLAGFNAATLEGPYQLQRRPRQAGMGDGNGPGYMRLAETMAQAVAETRALMGWLLAEQCPSVGLWGVSAGAALAGLTACCDARLSGVVMAAPGVRMNLSFGERVIWPRVREGMLRQRAAYEALNQTALNLTKTRPSIPKEHILLLEAIHDLCVGSEPIEELWQAWGRPEIWRLPRGHVTFPQGVSFADRVIRWLEPRLNNATVRTLNK